jgi:hypothetical protein
MEVLPEADYAADDMGSSGLSFERDIQPLSKRYFRAAYGRGGDAARNSEAFGRANDRLLGAFAKVSQLEEMDDRKKMRKVQFEAAQNALSTARKEAREEKNMLAGIAPVQDLLSSIIDDPETNEQQKRQEFAKQSIAMAGEIAKNPAVANMFRSAQFGIEGNNRPVFTVGDYMRTGGDYKYLEALRSSNPDVTFNADTPIDPIEAYSAAQREAENKRELTLKAEEKKESERQRLRVLNDTLSAVPRLKLTESVIGGGPPKFDATSATLAPSLVQILGGSEAIEAFTNAPDDSARLSILTSLYAQTTKRLAATKDSPGIDFSPYGK